MKSLFIVVLAIAAVQAEINCKPGTLFQKSCNWCRCLSDGKNVACTDKLCPEDMGAADQSCSPGTLFKKDCNICKCLADGKLAACTEMDCPTFKNFLDAGAQERICEPGKVFKLNNHNTCKCNHDGTKAMCTFTPSPIAVNALSARSSSQNGQYCEPGTTFNFDECNTCKCSADGTKAHCNFLACPKISKDMSEPKQACQPRSTFMDYCNTCFCADDGSDYSCTRMLCDKNIWNKNGTMKIHLQSFDQEESAPKQVCQPLTKFKQYCNTCSCSADGTTYACTDMYCDESVWNMDGTKKEQVCSPNTQFKEYCNTCFCSKNGMTKLCTMMDCDENVYNEDGSLKVKTVSSKAASDRACEPDSAYHPDQCNTCVCNKEGTYHVCTALACDNYEVVRYLQKARQWGPKYKQGDVCTPGKLFYSECNQCVCLKSGDAAYCTFKEC